MKQPKNAFLLFGYHSPEYYCNREGELLKLKEHQLNERNVVLFSWRRLGKSSLIKRFILEEERKGKLEAVYVDFLAATNIKEAIETLIQAVYNRFGKTKNNSFTEAFQQLLASIDLSVKFNSLNGLPKFTFGYQPNFNSKDTLQSIGEYLQQRDKQVVIAIDEFQQINHFEKDNAEAVFRNFMQEFPLIRFIFSGSHRQMMTSMFLESKRPFYKSCQLISLEPIPLEKYTPFIQNHFKAIGKEMPAELIKKIYDWARGQTYTVQLICNRFFGSNLPLTITSLEQIQHEILEEEAPIFANYFQLLTKTQWKVIRAIAVEREVENPQSHQFLQSHNLGAASSVRSALTTLIDKELVVQEDKKYFVHDLIFSRWLERR